MRKRSSPILGLVIADNEIVCAQVAAAGLSASVQKLGRFVDERCPANPPRPAWLAAFLESAWIYRVERRHRCADALVAVAGEGTATERSRVKPLAILRLQAERLVMADNTPTAVDFAGETDAAKSSRVLLVAMLQSQLDGLTAMASAAGLDVVGVTSTSLATAKLLNAASDRPLVMLGDKGSRGRRGARWARRGRCDTCR